MFHRKNDINNFENFSFTSKYWFLADFFNDLDKFSELKTQKEKKYMKDIFDIAH